MNVVDFYKKWVTDDRSQSKFSQEQFLKEIGILVSVTMPSESPEYYLMFDPRAAGPIRHDSVEGMAHYLKNECRNYNHNDWDNIRIVGVIEVEAWKPKRDLKVKMEQIDLE